MTLNYYILTKIGFKSIKFKKILTVEIFIFLSKSAFNQLEFDDFYKNHQIKIKKLNLDFSRLQYIWIAYIINMLKQKNYCKYKFPCLN